MLPHPTAGTPSEASQGEVVLYFKSSIEEIHESLHRLNYLYSLCSQSLKRKKYIEVSLCPSDRIYNKIPTKNTMNSYCAGMSV